MSAKKNIKLSILLTSRALFNEYSWSKISLRRIASELKISDGNLRYHFNKKEEIVLELFAMMTEEMMRVIPERVKNITDLEVQFHAIFKIMYSYRFLFIESYFIKKEYKSYLILFGQLEEAREALFMNEFNNLKQEKILSNNFSDLQYEMLFEQIFIISDSWMKYLDADDEAHVTQKIEHYAKLCYGLLVPYMIAKA